MATILEKNVSDTNDGDTDDDGVSPNRGGIVTVDYKIH